MRLFTLYCGTRHLEVRCGRLALVIIPKLALPWTHAPWWCLTTARQSGGTFLVRLGPLLLAWRCAL